MVKSNESGETTFATPSDTEIRITRVFDAPRALVWECWTDCRHLPHWMLGPEGWTMPICEIDLRPGGRHRSVWRHPDGMEMEITGVYQEVTPPERLVYTESWGPEWPETTDTLILTERDGQTTATLTMRYPSRAARDAALESGMKEGMAGSFRTLDGYLGGLA